MLLRDKLLSQGNLKEKEVTLSTGDVMLIRELSMAEQDIVREKSLKVGVGEEGQMSIESMKTGLQTAITIILATRNPETKENVFTMADLSVLMGKSENSWVSELAAEIGKLTRDSVKSVDEAKKQ